MSFGADKAVVFLGHQIGVIARLQANNAPFMIEMHYCAIVLIGLTYAVEINRV